MAFRRLIVTSVCCALVFPSISRAGGPGSAFGEGLRLTNTAWALGMGEAMVASAVGVSAISLNPAGVLDSSLTTLHITHIVFVEELSEDYFAFSQRLPFGSALGVSVHGVYDASTPRTLEDGSGNFAGEQGAFPVGFAVGGIAYALDLAQFLPWLKPLSPTGGVGLRVVWQQVDDETAVGLTADFGFKLKNRSGFMFGGVLQNAGVNSESSGFPLQWVAGVAWQHQGLLGQADRFLIEVDSPVAVDRALKIRLGSEYRIQFGKVSVAIRGGWKQEIEVPEAQGVSAGFGFRWFMGWTPWGMDYAFVPWGILGSQHAISLTVGLAPKRQRETPIRTTARPRELIDVFYPLMGETARYGFTATEPVQFTAALLDAEGNFIMTLYEPQVVGVGTVTVVWAGWLSTGVMAKFDTPYRIRVQLGESTWYKTVILKKH